MKAVLTKQQIQTAWNYAFPINEKNVPINIKKDVLGTRIKRDLYDKKDDLGWCAIYLIDPQTLYREIGNCANPFCEANVRILNIRNYYKSMDNLPGVFQVSPVDLKGQTVEVNNIHNLIQISEEGIQALKDTYNLSDEFLTAYFHLS